MTRNCSPAQRLARACGATIAGVTTVPRPIRVLEVLRVALVLGATSFGGPVAHLGYFRREYVERQRWLDDATFADLVALCQALPGPASSQLGIAIGTRRAGVAGGVAAWVGFTLPSAAALLALGLLSTSMDLSGAGWVRGLKLAAVVVVAHAVIGMARSLTPDIRRRVVALLAAAAALLLATPFAQVGIIAGGAAIGLLAVPAAAIAPGSAARSDSVDPRVGVACLVLFAALLAGLPVLRALEPASQPVSIVDAFYRAGSLVFGGGHVVLPLLGAETVDPGWVSPDTFLAGYGAAQAVPGPLFTFAAYLGAVSTVPPAGVIGGLLALGAIFLPSFLLVFGVLPFWDRLRAWATFRRALGGVNAAVVGLLAAALYDPVATSAIGGPVDLALALAGLAVLAWGRVPVVAIVGAFALLGEVLVRLG